MNDAVRRLRRACYFLWAYACVSSIHRTIARHHIKGAQRKFVRSWKTNSRTVRPDLIADIGWAVAQACGWHSKKCVCLHRSLAAYTLLRGVGARPVFVIAVRARPFASHAWTEIDGVPVADEEMEYGRFRYTSALRFPEAAASRHDAPTLPRIGLDSSREAVA